MILTDGRYFRCQLRAGLGHITPEAKRGGGILYLQTGESFNRTCASETSYSSTARRARTRRGYGLHRRLTDERRELGVERLRRINRRLFDIAATNRMRDVTDAPMESCPTLWRNAHCNHMSSSRTVIWLWPVISICD